jgi:hypothetical protein
MPTLPVGKNRLPLKETPDVFARPNEPARVLTFAARILTLVDKDMLLAFADTNVAASVLTLADSVCVLDTKDAARVLTFADRD